MKRILSHLFVVVLLMLSATSWAQNATRTITVIPSDGTYNRDNWSSKWESTADGKPKTVITVSNGINNMNSNAKGDNFQFYVGQVSPSTWNFTVDGCVIVSYSFDFKSVSNSITITAGDKTISSSSSSQKWSVSGLNTQSVSFQLSGGNNGIVVSNLTFEVREILEEGQVYMFKNARPDTDRTLSADGTTDVHTMATNVDDTKQQWYVTKVDGLYVLRNVETGKYLKGNVKSSAWSMSDSYSDNYNKFTLHTSNADYNTLHTNTLGDYAYMHDDNNGDDGGCNIVGWSNGNTDYGSHWTITKVEYTDEQLDALFDNFISEETIRLSLSNIFSDAACTLLNESYRTMTDVELKADASYSALPSVLKEMVRKVRDDNWSEANADNAKEAWGAEYAKKFRVQMYEPYSAAKTGSDGITSWLGINWHANNDNPTGIYMPAAGKVYVMVEGEIADGATLRIVDAGSNDRITNASSVGVALQSGLNVINYIGGTGMLYICYNVDTYNPNGTDNATKFPHKLSAYSPLKIHIEGGAINGFYNACGDFLAGKKYDGVTYNSDLWKEFTGASVDKDADWEYMETRANLSVLPIIGHREILLLQLEDEQGGPGLRSLLPERINCPEKPYSNAESWAAYGMGCDPEKGKINIVMEAWDRIMYSQLATMGLVSNSHMDRMNNLYPRWTKEGARAEMYDYDNESNIDNKTYLQFCQGVDYSEYFNHHGVILGTGGGNPYGSGDHVGYPIGGFAAAVYDLPNTAGSTWGPAHEIGHQHQALLTLSGLTEVTNNLFSNIALWYKGMSTSRYNGNDGSLEQVLKAFNTNGSDIYTNNIWALTHLYYRLWLYYHLAGNNTQFYPRLFELLRHDPMVRTYMQSGDVSTLHFYKLACQAAGEDLTEFFRVHGYFSVMEDRFVGDYSNSIYNVSQQMIDEAIAEVKAMDYPENLSIIFINDDDETATYLQHDGKTAREIYNETKPNSDSGSVSDFIAGNEVTTPYTATLDSDGTITMSGGTGGVGFLILNDKGEIISFSNKSTFEIGDEAKHALVSGTATVVSISSDNTIEPLEAVVDVVATRKEVLAGLIADVQAVIGKEDNTYTKVGYFKSIALAELKTALAAAEEELANGTGYEGAYEVLYSEYRKVIDNHRAKVSIDTNLSYTIKNKAYTTRNITVSNETAYVHENATGTAAEWHFEQSTTAGKYYLKNSDGGYCTDVRTSVPLAVDKSKEKAALYALQELDHGVWAIVGENSNFHAAASQSYAVVGWGTDAQASQWYITAKSTVGNAEALAGLEVLISNTERLVDELSSGKTITKGDACQLQTTVSSSSYYLSSNAPSTEGSISHLVDGIIGNNGNYYHSDWSSEPPSGSHYLLVDLGVGNTLERFTISHTTRSGASSDFPMSVDVFGSNDGNSYYYIGSADKMPQSANTYWEYNGVFTSVPYRYLRFNVHANRGYWHMAEFDLYPVTDVTPAVKDIYSTGSAVINAETLKTALNKMLTAKAVANSNAPSGDDIINATSELQTAYNNLLDEYKVILCNKLQSLKEIADATEVLIAQVGIVAEPMSGNVDLQINNPSDAYYISTNADHNTGGGRKDGDGIAALVDDNENTYFHTRWEGTAVNEPHYIQVYLDKNVTAKEFVFSYKPRNGSPAPTAMTVYGSNDANSFSDVLTTIESGLPAHNSGNKYSSERIETKGYRYLRFTVTSSDGPGNETYSGQYFFGMLEFDLELFSDLTFAVNGLYSEVVSKELFESTYFTTEASNSIYETGIASMGTDVPLVTVELLDAQIADQMAAKEALYAAKLSAESYTLAVTDVGYATLYLGFNAIIPAGVEAYYVDGINMRGNADMVQISNVLPAETGVIIKAAKGKYTFKYSNKSVAAIENNMLKGTLEDTLINKKAGHTYYVLANKSGIGFYEAIYNGNSNQFSNAANKAYLCVPSTMGAASFYGFDWGGTTGIDEVKGENGEVKAIYDLTGRRVEAITAPGIYIVNGKKVLVK
ncbi:MAG: M60 family metallopeptidase [Bacteroidaceae bacterium]|nr:M60 family metallopeptidase [Bacteroidaceae bacterium]